MIQVVISGQSSWLVPYGPNTDDAVNIKARTAVDTQRRLTGRRSGRPQANLLRCRMSWGAQIKQAQFAAARDASLQSQDEPIVAPFWPAARPIASAAATTCALTIAWTRDWSAFAINPGSLVGYDCFAPLLFGRFSQPPRRTGRNSDVVKVEFSIDEDSPAAYLAGGRLGLSAALIEQTRARFASACAGWPARIEASFLSAERKTRYLTLLAQRRERLGGL